MPLILNNTMTRRKEEFKPIDPKNVRMYVCGPTVYDRAHIGNARPIVVFDTLYRLLKMLYPKVGYARNITDVDDKIMNKAKETGKPIKSITEETTRLFHEDIAELNALPPDFEPRATEHIKDMQDLIGELLEKGFAYEAEGHVLFSVAKLKDYGKLSGRSMDEMIAGARVEVAPYKKDPADFILWKPSSPDQPGWDSPWGFGRPGWHLECSAMSEHFFGDSFDIHGGGQDLIFPHHENEIAQSCGAHGPGTYAKYWVHNGHLMVNGEKMSKSLGNFFTVREVLDKVPGEAVRLYLLTTHYHQPLNWTEDGLKQAKQTMDRFYTAFRMTENVKAAENEKPDPELLEALLDDLNTPKAISILHQKIGLLNKTPDPKIKGEIKASAALLGILMKSTDEWFNAGVKNAPSEQEILTKIEERKQAKKAKDYALSDKIRQDLSDRGVLIEDTKEGTLWRYK